MPRAERDRELMNLLESIEGQTGSPRRGSRPTSTISSRPLSGQRLSSGSGDPVSEAAAVTSNPTITATIYASTSTQTLAGSPTVTVSDTTPQSLPEPKKPEVILYDKGVQTEAWESPKQSRGTGVQWADQEVEEDDEAKEKELERIRDDLRKEIEEELRATLDTTKLEPTNGQAERFPLRTISDEELKAVVGSQDFREFVDQSSKIIDRALDEQYDLLIDYAQGSENVDDDDDAYGKGRRRGRRVKQVSQFWHDRWSKKRMISDISFSPKVFTRALFQQANSLSIRNFSWLHTPKIHPHLTSHTASSRFGTPTPHPNLSSPFTIHLPTFSPPSSLRFTLTSWSVAATAGKSSSGTPERRPTTPFKRLHSQAWAIPIPSTLST
jgi:dynein intermediate chain